MSVEHAASSVTIVVGVEQEPTREQRLADALTQLLQFIDRVGGFSTPEDQATIRYARAVLAEGERR